MMKMLQPPTPCLVIDLPTVERNIARLAAYASSHGLKVRPHSKTHKSRHIGRLQVEAGAVGLTVAKIGEAEEMLHVCSDLLIAYPAIDPNRADHVARLAGEKSVRVAVDSIECIDAIASMATARGTTVGILIDLDVGHHRTGAQSATDARHLARHVAASRGVRLDGIMCFPGHVLEAAAEQGGPLASVAAILQEAIDLWHQDGLPVSIVSGGSSPTAYQSHLVPALTEIRPGTYVYNDANMVAGKWCDIDDCAARIHCTVVSNAVKGKVVVDAGSKTFTSDRRIFATNTTGHGIVIDYPAARIVRLSEEHGEIDVSACSVAPRLGQRLEVIPNHICPCVNLHTSFWLRNSDGELTRTSVDARGMTI
jgi:D-serine deaminase-like pyridoxal phosphate-dependent protein